MKVIVLNGSPKGDNSVTMAYVRYLAAAFPRNSFEVLPIAQTVRRLEQDRESWRRTIQSVRDCDAVLWAFPLYFLLVHSSFKRFIELAFERHEESAFAGKYAATLSTSIHFFDHTAHNYIHAISEDLGMRFAGSFSAGMNDLMDERERKNLVGFCETFLGAVGRQRATARVFPKLEAPTLSYEPGALGEKVDNTGLSVVILTESGGMSRNLRMMVERFKACFAIEPDVVDLSAIRIAGPCLGCLKCGMDNACAYDGRDDVRDTYEKRLKSADIVIFASTMKDRYFSSRWKEFLDRRFYRTHQPAFPGKQVGYLVSGPLALEANLRQMLQAATEIDQAHLVDIVTDECATSADLDALVSGFAERLAGDARAGAMTPRTFLGVGGAKIFRDEMWGDLRFIFQKDYDYYRRHGMLDFPQSRPGTMLMHHVAPLLRLGPVKRQVQARTTVMMHRSHDLVVKSLKEKK